MEVEVKAAALHRKLSQAPGPRVAAVRPSVPYPTLSHPHARLPACPPALPPG